MGFFKQVILFQGIVKHKAVKIKMTKKLEVTILQLTQKEILHLQDALEHEQICIKKYNNYANQTQDTELATLFNDLANNEQQHVDTITQILQQGGAQPMNQ